jgi:hypothetical protein
MSSLYSFYKNTPGLQVKRDMDFSNVTVQCDPRLVVPNSAANQTSGLFKKDTAGKLAVEHEICDLSVSNLTVNGQTTLVNTTAANLTVSGTITGKKVVDGRFNAATTLEDTLTASESGTMFLVNGAAANIINLPALSTDNVGVTYDFFLTGGQAVGTTTIVVPSGNFIALLSLIGGGAANPIIDLSGTTLTLATTTAVGARISITCLTDTGSGTSSWSATTISTPLVGNG